MGEGVQWTNQLVFLGDQLICSLYTLLHLKPEYRTDCSGAHEKVVLEGFSGVINWTTCENVNDSLRGIWWRIPNSRSELIFSPNPKSQLSNFHFFFIFKVHFCLTPNNRWSENECMKIYTLTNLSPLKMEWQAEWKFKESCFNGPFHFLSCIKRN